MKHFIKAHFGSLLLAGVILSVALLASVLLFAQGPQPSDDAYITFRHVRNLLEHGIPAWNLHSKPVMGSTSPAFLFGLALFAKLTNLEISRAAFALNVGLMFGIVLLAYLAARDLLQKRFAALLASILIGINSVNISIFSEGFESALFVLASFAALYAVRQRQDILSLVLASLAPLIRPEGIFLSVLVWIALVIEKRFRWKLIPAYSLLPALWLAFSLWYYGSPVPNSIRAKTMLPAMYAPYQGTEVKLLNRLPQLPLALAELWNSKVEPLLLQGYYYEAITLRNVFRTPLWKKTLLALAVLSWLAALLDTFKRKDTRFVYLLYAPLLLVFYAWIGHVLPWYFPPLITFSILSLWAGCLFAAQRFGQWLLRFKKSLPRGLTLRLGFYAGFALVIFSTFLMTNRYAFLQKKHWHGGPEIFLAPLPRRDNLRNMERDRFLVYRQAAEYLNRQSQNPGTALITEVGVFGYYYRGEVLDSLGLCSPEVFPFYPPPIHDTKNRNGKKYNANTIVPTALVMSLQPDYVINSAGYIENLIQADSPFRQKYQWIGEAGMVWEAWVMIFEKNK